MAAVDSSQSLRPLLPPCRVCGDKASGFHYGANTCEGCKVFFRRSLKRQVEYKCVSEEQCSIVSGSRNSCQHCRFQKCVRVGMSRSAIRHGRYTHSTRTRNILEVKRLQHYKKRCGDKRSCDNIFDFDTPAVKREMCTVDGLPIKQECMDYDDSSMLELPDYFAMNTIVRKTGVDYFTASLNANQKSHLKTLTQAVDYASENFDLPESSSAIKSEPKTPSMSPLGSTGSSLDSCGSDCYSPPYCVSPSLLDDTCSQQSVFDPVPSPELFTQDLDSIADELNPLLDDFPEYLMGPTIPVASTQSLGLAATDYNCILEIMRDSDEQKWLEQASALMESYIKFCKALPGFGSLSVVDQAALIKGARNEVLLIQSQNLVDTLSGMMVVPAAGGTSIKFDSILDHLGSEGRLGFGVLVKRFRELHLSRSEQGLLVAVLTTSTDRPDVVLENKAAVEQLHSTFLEALQVSLSTNHPRIRRTFSKVIQLLTDLRTHSHNSRDLVHKLISTQPHLNVPLVLAEIFYT